MTDHDAHRLETTAAAPGASQVQAELARLAAEYPAFRFRAEAGWLGDRLRWIAERIRGLEPGVHTVITADLGELRTELDDEGRHM